MNRKLTIIKVLGPTGHPSAEDIKRWREVFAQNLMTEEEAVATGEVSIENVPTHQDGVDDQTITFVKVGDEDFSPTVDDLQRWKDVFEEASKDPDFKIFTHPAVEISVIKVGKIVAVE